MRNLFIILMSLFIISCSESDEKIDDTNPVYLDENGVTIKARDWAVVGDVGIINGIGYTIVDASTLDEMIKNGDDVRRVCTSRITKMNEPFKENRTFNQDISSWDVSNVTEMIRMFEKLESFNQDISKWDVGKVNTMDHMFDGAFKFNQDISSWDVSNVTNMNSMFWLCSEFSQDLTSWDVGNTTRCSNFAGGFSNWGSVMPRTNWPNFTKC